jgi:hypothetical protein
LERTRVLFTMELYCTPKVNTLQLNTVGNSSNTRTRPTCTVSEHSLLYNSSNRTSCGNLPTLAPILAVRKLPNTPGQSIVGLSVRLHTTTVPRRIVHH